MIQSLGTQRRLAQVRRSALACMPSLRSRSMQSSRCAGQSAMQLAAALHGHRTANSKQHTMIMTRSSSHNHGNMLMQTGSASGEQRSSCRSASQQSGSNAPCARCTASWPIGAPLGPHATCEEIMWLAEPSLSPATTLWADMSDCNATDRGDDNVDHWQHWQHRLACTQQWHATVCEGPVTLTEWSMPVATIRHRQT